MTLYDLGYDAELEKYREAHDLMAYDVGRVISEQKERYVVRGADSEYDAEVIGNIRYSATDRTDFPAVGDWVAIKAYEEGKALIYALFPRKTMIERSAVGKPGNKQIIATNIDDAFIVQSVDRDFNINRMERYLTICNSSGIHPAIILSKTDLITDLQLAELIQLVQTRIRNVPIIALSNETGTGYEELARLIRKGKTCCMLGSSGVGKSTIINNLAGARIMKTGVISESTNKGRHITSHRQLVVLELGGILIDNPGMREVGITDSDAGVKTTFDAITVLAAACKYKDCTHTDETGCAVIEAVGNGEVDRASYENYLRLEREKAHFEATLAERRKKEKDFGKMLKQYKRLNK